MVFLGARLCFRAEPCVEAVLLSRSTVMPSAGEGRKGRSWVHISQPGSGGLEWVLKGQSSPCLSCSPRQNKVMN